METNQRHFCVGIQGRLRGSTCLYQHPLARVIQSCMQVPCLPMCGLWEDKVQQMYHLTKPVKCMESLFYATHSYVNMRDIVKNWVKESLKFRKTPTYVYKMKSLTKAYQFLIIFSSRIYGQGNTKTLLEGWALLLDQLVNDRMPFNWSDILAHQLKTHVAKAHNLPKNEKARFDMSTYLLDAIYAQQQFPDMS